MKKLILSIVLILALSSCASERIVYKDRIQKVNVPVYINPPKPADPRKPTSYPIDNVKKGNTDLIAKALVATSKLKDAYIERLESVIQVYIDNAKKKIDNKETEQKDKK